MNFIFPSFFFQFRLFRRRRRRIIIIMMMKNIEISSSWSIEWQWRVCTFPLAVWFYLKGRLCLAFDLRHVTLICRKENEQGDEDDEESEKKPVAHQTVAAAAGAARRTWKLLVHVITHIIATVHFSIVA